MSDDDDDDDDDVVLKSPADLKLIDELGKVYPSSEAAKETGSNQEQTQQAWADASEDSND